MTDFTVDDILMPLAITVIIDKKIRDPEMNAYCEWAETLMPLFNLPIPPRKDIIDWFNNHEPIISEKLKGPRKNTSVLVALTKFKEDIHVENIYEAMVAISICDQEYKREESELIKSAGLIWGYNRPPIKVDD